MKSKKTAKPHPMPVDALVYPRFSGVPTFMRLPHVPQAGELDLALIGIPFDGAQLTAGRAFRAAQHSRAIRNDSPLESGAEAQSIRKMADW